MRKAYETPSVEVVKFRYSDQVVASSGAGGGGSWDGIFGKDCGDVSFDVFFDDPGSCHASDVELFF